MIRLINPLFCSFFIVLLISCTDNVIRLKVQHSKLTQQNSDTFCLPKLPLYSHIRILKYCHIILDDSLSDQLTHAFTQGKLPEKYNYDNFESNLHFVKNGDTIELRKLYMVKNRNFRIMPDTVFFSKDTLFFGEKAIRLGSDPDFEDFRFEEVCYQCIIDKQENFCIRDLDYTRHYLNEYREK